jgi:hypothetical protein
VFFSTAQNLLAIQTAIFCAKIGAVSSLGRFVPPRHESQDFVESNSTASYREGDFNLKKSQFSSSNCPTPKRANPNKRLHFEEPSFGALGSWDARFSELKAEE